MLNRILSIVLLAASVWIVVGFVRPQFAVINAVKVLITERQETLKNAERVIEKRDSIMKNYAAISDEQKDKLKKLLPDRIDAVRTALDLSVLANAYGLEIDDIDVGGLSRIQPKAEQAVTYDENGVPQPAPENDSPSFVPAGMELGLSGRYEGFLAFITDLEQSLKIADLKVVELDASNQSEEENKDIYKYSLSLQFYQFSE